MYSYVWLCVAMYVCLCMCGYVCLAMMYGYVCMMAMMYDYVCVTMHVWLGMYCYVCFFYWVMLRKGYGGLYKAPT